jgi:hypothetical protein
VSARELMATATRTGWLAKKKRAQIVGRWQVCVDCVCTLRVCVGVLACTHDTSVNV